MTATAPMLGAQLTGLLSPYPVYAATLAAFAHRLEGPAAARAVLRGGIVGFRLPALQAKTASIARGDLLVFATDGVSAGFAETVVAVGPPQRLAEQVLDRNFRGTDDALVLVAKYLGTGSE